MLIKNEICPICKGALYLNPWDESVCLKCGRIIDGKTIRTIDEIIEDSEYNLSIEKVIDTINKRVKLDLPLIKHVTYTGLSAYGPEPNNLGVLATTSEGKTYVIVNSLRYFPKEDVWYIGGMSPTDFYYERGVIENNEGEDISEQINELQEIISLAKKDSEDYRLAKKNLKELLAESRTVIDFWGKILVFLDSPHRKLWNNLKTILSHDCTEIEFRITQPDKSGRNHSQLIIVRGWPAVIFASAKDESQWSMWTEIESRFVINSPNMNKEKYLEANKVTSKKTGLPQAVLDQEFSSKDEEQSKKIIENLKEVLSSLMGDFDRRKEPPNLFWNPAKEVLEKNFPHNEGPDMRRFKFFNHYLQMSCLAHFVDRARLVVNNKEYLIIDGRDIKEVSDLFPFESLPQHKMKWFNEVFLPCYAIEGNKLDNIEKIDGVTSKELMDYTFKIYRKRRGGESIRQTFLAELELKGYVYSVPNPLDKRSNLWRPTNLDGKNEEYPTIGNSCIFTLYSLEKAWNELKKYKFEPMYIKFRGSRLNSVHEIASSWSYIQTTYFSSNIQGDLDNNASILQLNEIRGYITYFGHKIPMLNLMYQKRINIHTGGSFID